MAWSGDRRDIERHTPSQASYKIAMIPTLVVLNCLMGTSPQSMTRGDWTEVATFGRFGEDRAGCHKAGRMYLVAVRHWHCLPFNEHPLPPRSPSGRHDPTFPYHIRFSEARLVTCHARAVQEKHAVSRQVLPSPRSCDRVGRPQLQADTPRTMVGIRNKPEPRSQWCRDLPPSQMHNSEASDSI